MGNLKGKKLLVLGGTQASLDLVEMAKAEGAYTVVADYLETGVAKEIADETVRVSTSDIDSLLALIKARGIDGVFCGPSEFQLLNVMSLCELSGLPFYATRAQWDRCGDKLAFKEMCREYGVPCVPEYHVTGEFLAEDLAKIIYPVMVKPTDGCSSRGISVCHNHDELKKAYAYALEFSDKKKVIVEKYIISDQAVIVRYVAYQGEIHLLLVNSRYVVDSQEGTAYITAFARFPAKCTDEYIEQIDGNVRAMMKGLGLENGAFFLQALVDRDDNKIYFHEMGLRISGGFIFKMVEPLTGVNDMKMLMRYALGEDMACDGEIAKIDPYLGGKTFYSLAVPLKTGVIGSISGLQSIAEKIPTLKITQYYQVGDTITGDMMGTLSQHFGRFKFVEESDAKALDTLQYIQSELKISDADGNDMIYKRFDIKRAQ